MGHRRHAQGCEGERAYLEVDGALPATDALPDDGEATSYRTAPRRCQRGRPFTSSAVRRDGPQVMEWAKELIERGFQGSIATATGSKASRRFPDFAGYIGRPHR